MMRRRFRRKSTWIWATKGNFTLVDTGEVVGAPQWASDPAFLPVGRVEWLLDNQIRRSALTVQRILVWYRLFVNTAAQSGPVKVLCPDCDLYIIKTSADTATDVTQFTPYAPPPLPASVTAWAVGSQTDGLDPYLWTDHVFVPESNVFTVGSLTNADVPNATQGADGILATTAAGIWSYPPRVGLASQPSIDLRVKRRLTRDDGLVFGINVPAMNSNCRYTVDYAARFLAS